MKTNKLWLITVSLLLILLVLDANAQKKPARKTPAETSKAASKNKQTESENPQDEQRVRDIIAFLQYVLNTLGSRETPARDKDVLITESYTKIFRDEKVQIEDDLDEGRKVITNKDVVAYLKDVDFFFDDVKFEFTIDDIKKSATAGGQVFYKISLRRNLTGTTADGQTISNTKPRYIEINFNADDQDLKIVSIYTNEFDESEALTSWWNGLSYEWQSIFRKKLNLTDSVKISDIKNITAIDELDLSGNSYIQDITPLAQLLGLKLLNLSGTNISDLTPIRNLTELVELDLSRTKVHDLLPLKYATKLERLNIDRTKITDLSATEKMIALQHLSISAITATQFDPLANLTSLTYLNLKGTKIANLTPLQNLVQLMELNASKTRVTDLTPLKALKSLNVLNIDSTAINNITTLDSLINLSVLYANYTRISDLQPLQNLPRLERVYCDQTSITREKADAFMAANKRVLVVYDSKDLAAWWQTLSSAWQRVLSNATGIALSPSKEALAKVTNLDSINFAGNTAIADLEALRRLQKLQVIIAGNTAITGLSPLEHHREIRYLDISETEVNDLSVAKHFAKLKVLKADKSKIENIIPLYGNSSIEKVYADHTAIHDITAQEFLAENPGSLIVYKTVHLNRWWNNLPEGWRRLFRMKMQTDTTVTRETLHQLVEQQTLQFNDVPVRDLSALNEFVRLKELHFSGTAITSISPLENLKSLTSLRAVNSPLHRITSLRDFTALQEIDISNTPVDDLGPIEKLTNLKQLNCSGTQVKKLNPLKALKQLEHLDCANTKVRSLDPVMHLSLKSLTCYNTKISKNAVKKFKDKNPECDVVYYR